MIGSVLLNDSCLLRLTAVREARLPSLFWLRGKREGERRKEEWAVAEERSFNILLIQLQTGGVVHLGQCLPGVHKGCFLNTA